MAAEPPDINEPDHLTDQREQGFYIVDDEVVDEYGAKIGPLGLAVYNVLVKHANKSGTSCFPSYQTIADKLGITRNTAMKGVDILVEHKLIRKDSRTDASGAPTSNNYKILHVKKAHKSAGKVVQNSHHPTDLSDAGGANSAPPSQKSAPPLVQNSHQPSANSAPEPDPSNQTPLNQTHTHPPGHSPPVCACKVRHESEFCDDVRLAYARNQPRIDNPEGYAQSKDVRGGRDDAFIRKWLVAVEQPVVATPVRETSACPDCHGSGFFYPQGPQGGVVRCKHPSLAGAAGAQSSAHAPPARPR